MTSRAERQRVGRELEARGLVPNRAEQAEIRREAEEVARRVARRRRVTAHQAVVILLGQRDDPLDNE